MVTTLGNLVDIEILTVMSRTNINIGMAALPSNMMIYSPITLHEKFSIQDVSSPGFR